MSHSKSTILSFIFLLIGFLRLFVTRRVWRYQRGNQNM